MKTIFFYITFGIFFLYNVTGSKAAFPDSLSASSYISVITCDPGEEGYSSFGHTAIRIRDTAQQIDWVFNYGTFDFNQPNFYGRFAKGQLNYKLSAYDYRYFDQEYKESRRAMYEQILNLNDAQKQSLYNKLKINYQPENREYLYDYFYDNCATRVRDIVEQSLDNRISWNYLGLDSNRTIRQLTEPYIEKRYWLDLGIDLCLGVPMDKKISFYQYMFLPDAIKISFGNSYIITGNDSVPLVAKAQYIYETPRVAYSDTIPTALVTWLVFVLALVVLILEVRRKKWYTLFDRIFFALLGAIGCLLLFLWVGTDHQAARPNFNMLFFIPLHIFIVFLLQFKKAWRLVRIYFRFTAMFGAFVLGGWFVLPQWIHYAFLPIVLAVIIRSMSILRHAAIDND